MNDFLPGRLGLARSRIPHADRHGLLWLSRGNLYVDSGTLRFLAADSSDLPAGDYAIPYQAVSMVLMAPGTTVSHDALRILARHGTLIAVVGEGGAKFYSAPPLGPGKSRIARKHAELWARKRTRTRIALEMYRRRFGGKLEYSDLNVLRGLEGARVRETYRLVAHHFGVPWHGRRYNRDRPEQADLPNRAINHAATFVVAAAEVAVTAVGALAPLGFIHEESSNAFALDIADLYRAEITLPLAFSAARRAQKRPGLSLESFLRNRAVAEFRKRNLIPSMIDDIKEFFGANDPSR